MVRDWREGRHLMLTYRCPTLMPERRFDSVFFNIFRRNAGEFRVALCKISLTQWCRLRIERTTFCALGFTEINSATPPMMKKMPNGTGRGKRINPIKIMIKANAVNIVIQKRCKTSKLHAKADLNHRSNV